MHGYVGLLPAIFDWQFLMFVFNVLFQDSKLHHTIIYSMLHHLVFSTNTSKMAVSIISKCRIMPENILDESLEPCYLTAWDLSMLSLDYIQTGLLFKKPQHIVLQTILDQLKHSLSTTLTHFFPLSGRLVSKKNVDLSHPYYVFLDCKDGQGAEFVHAVAPEITISDLLSPVDVPAFVESLFALDRPIVHDGHTLPLLSVQITELVDGIFVGCSFNHVVGDGCAFWNFFNAWSNVCRSKVPNENKQGIFSSPLTTRWFINAEDRILNLPFSHPDEFIDRFVPKTCRERVFHFTSESIAHLKAKTNAELSSSNNNISSFKALAVLVWRSVTRARGLLPDQLTKCWITMDNRSRLEPPLPKDYFGNCVHSWCVVTTAGELLGNNSGWCASLVEAEVASHTHKKVHSIIEALTRVPSVYQLRHLVEPGSLVFGMSPRFDVYSNDFGWGAPVAVRSGFGLKVDGKVTWYPGREGGGSMDLEICLSSETMNALESDNEFMDVVSPMI